jgi:citrate lyase subunit beta/citryl-CoA lyase
MIRAGQAGPGVRADVQITAVSAASFSFSLRSSTSPLYDDSIRREIEAMASAFGHPPVHLDCVDSGALPFTWRARLQTALGAATGQKAPIVEPCQRPAREGGLLRTRLYVPANIPKLLPNAGLSRPDAVIFDLEDAVAPDQKVEAVDLLEHALLTLDWGDCERIVRLNSGERGDYELDRLCRFGVDTFIIPKVEHAEELQRLDARLSQLQSPQRLFPLIESALGVENAFAIASASPRVKALSLGLEDYVRDIGAIRTAGQDESVYARSRVLNAARAAGIMPLASVFPGFEDEGALTAYVQQARNQGYEGIGCIHPAQVPVVHAGFVPSGREVEWARAVLSACERALAEGKGATRVGGEMVDGPTYARAQRIVARSEVLR